MLFYYFYFIYFIRLFICLFIYLFICLFIYLFIKGGCCTVCFSSLSSEQTPNQHHPMAQNMKYITVTKEIIIHKNGALVTFSFQYTNAFVYFVIIDNLLGDHV